MAVALGLWVESVWAWWIGLVLTSVVVVIDLARGVIAGLVVWGVFLALFALSALHGLRDRHT